MSPSMKVAHVALWCRDLESVASFWANYFDATVGAPYQSLRRPGFVSRFVQLGEGASLELMSGPWLMEVQEQAIEQAKETPGWAHVAISLGSVAQVDALAARLQQAGLLHAPPRYTGDGFYEAVVQDPEGNLIEITS